MAGTADVIARLSVWLGIDTAAFEKGADIGEKRLAKMQREFTKLGDRMQDIGKKMSVAITAPVAGIGAAVLKMSGDFESSMIKLGISSQATAGEMKQMSELALKLGKDTIFGASDAVNAMDELAKAGLDAQTILNGAATAAVNLATATGSELSPAATAITDTIKQFGLATSQLPDAVNQITGAVNQSKLDFQDYALAIGQAGGVAGGLGVDFVDFNTTLAATSSLFASGSDAGTSFKTFLTSLAGNSKEAKKAIAAFGLEFFDANGGMRSMAEIAEELRTKLGGLSDQAKTEVLKDIFGTDAMRTAIGLMKQGAAGLDEVAAAIGRTDAAAQSAKRMEGFYGQLENLKGAVETLAIRIGQSGVLEAITALITKLGDLVDWLSETSPAILSFVTVVAAMAAVVGPAIFAVGKLTSIFSPLLVTITTRLIPAFIAFRLQLVAIATLAGPAQAAMAGIAISARAAGTALLAAFGGPIGATIAGVALVIGGLAFVSRDTAASLEDLEAASGKTEARLADAKRQAQAAGIQIKALDSTAGSASGSFSALTSTMWKSVEAMSAIAKNAKIAALATIELENAIARQTKSKLEPRLNILDAAASRNRRFSALFGQNVSGTEDLPDSVRAQLDVDRARVKAADTILARNKETAEIIKKLPTYAPGDATAPPQVVAPISPPAGGDDDEKKDRSRRARQGTDPLDAKFREEQDMRALQMEVLRAQEELATTAEDRAEFQRQALALDREGREAEITEAVRKKELTAEEAKARREIVAQLYGQLLTEDGTGDLIVEKQKSLYGELQTREELRAAEQERAIIAQAEYDVQREALDHAYDMADTQGERRVIALRILELEEKQQRAILDGILATEAVNSARYKEAKILLDGLDAQFANRRESALRETEGPGERFAREVIQTPAQINEAIEGIKVDGLKALNQGLTDAIMGFKSLGDVARNILQQITAELINMAIRALIIKPLAGALGIPGFALGTNFAPGGLAIVGERGPELVNLPRGSRVTPNNELAGMGSGGNVYKPTFVFPGVTNAAQAREAGAQAARRFRQSINGPVRT